MNPVDPYGLLKAVLENPADDLPRLAYADWLAENGHPERAEFIQVQCNLNSFHPDPHNDSYWDGQLGKGPKHYEIRKAWRNREQSLKFNNLQRWRDRDWVLGKTTWNDPDDREPTVGISFSRGFVSEVRLTLDDFMVKDVAGHLFSYHPIEKVTLTDKEPDLGIGWYNAERDPTSNPPPHPESDLPKVLYDFLPDEGCVRRIIDRYKVYSVNLAVPALSAACVLYGKQQAKLVKP